MMMIRVYQIIKEHIYIADFMRIKFLGYSISFLSVYGVDRCVLPQF